MKSHDAFVTLTREIQNGEYDDYMELLKGICINRHLMLQVHQPDPNTQINFPKTFVTKNINDFRVGQRVRFNSRVTPRYMIGKIARVTKVNRERVKIQLEGGAVGRFDGENMSCPISIIDIIP